MSAPSTTEADPHREGFALVAVMGFLLVAAAFITPFAITARTQHLITLNLDQQLRLDGWAEAIGQIVAQSIARSPDDLRIPSDSTPVLCEIGEYKVQVRRQDQKGLIDLNAAGSDLISLGFQSLGFEKQLSLLLAQAVILHRSYEIPSAEAAAKLPVSAGMKHASLESVAELYDLDALNETEIADLHLVFTVHSKRGEVSGPDAPKRLASFLDNMDAHRPSVTTAVETFSLEVSVSSNKTSISGYSGFIFQPSSLPNQVPTRLEPLLAPIVKGANLAIPETCSPGLHAAVSDLLREIAL
ncbi:hypothetical protein [Nitratireductor sp. ZSWI3]|uniref:hypothetical protein n=1 Tax=Nitratireductor sp. ZSWI3 TaxID=2966359 RepID=UPI00214FD3AA|nr:hypothetical protein [Nitratireductor sp. ZSWI3]MCR4265789.1 hypothetical protein [Nitratireductor sp. ZSWI3]